MQRRLFLNLTSAQGCVNGGNLAMVGSIWGNPWQIEVQDAVLSIKDLEALSSKIGCLFWQDFGCVSNAGAAYVN